MSISTFVSNTVTVSTTELSLLNGNSTIAANTSAGVYQVFVDLNAMTVSEQYQLKIYEKTISGGTQRVIQDVIFSGVQGNPIYASPSLILLNGWDMSLKKLAGTDRSLIWSIRAVQ